MTTTAIKPIFIIEDNSAVRKDIKDTLKQLGVKTLDKKDPQTYYDLLFAVFYETVDGVLIDIDLSSFELESIFIGERLQIDNGIGLAKFIYEYNPNLPIAVYSADLQRFEAELEDLPASIDKYAKNDNFWRTDISVFCNKVETEQKYRSINASPTKKQFEEYNDTQKLYEIRKASSKINGNKYFKAMGDYAWFLECGGIAKTWHGPIIGESDECSINNSDILNDDQRRLAIDENLEIQNNLNKEILSELFNATGRLPIIHWNFTSPQTLKAIQKYYKDFALGNSPVLKYRKNAYYHELGEHLAKFYVKQEMNKTAILNILNGLPDEDKQFLKLNFVKEIFKAKSLDLKRNPESIGELRQDVLNITNFSIEDIFICEITEIDDTNDAATVKMKHLYRRDADPTEILSLKFLKQNTGNIATLYTKFEYVVYTPAIGGGAFKINLLI